MPHPLRFRPRRTRRLALVPAAAAALALGVGACRGLPHDEPELRCATLGPPPGAPTPALGDTLEMVVVLEPRSDPVELLLRVDPLEEEGVVVFPEDVPPTAAAAGVTLGTAGRFTVCVGPAPAAIVFQGSRAPHDKAWARVSANRPVRASLRVGGEGGVTLGPALVVEPGHSGRRRWAVPEGGP